MKPRLFRLFRQLAIVLLAFGAPDIAHASNNAHFVSQSVPSVMVPGQTYAVSVTMKNTGTTTWNAGRLYRLGSRHPRDNTTWGMARVELPGPVESGVTVVFSFYITAPRTVGVYNFQWRMVEDLVEWFGDHSPNVAIRNGVNDAAFVSQNVPGVMAPGRTYAVSVTMRNTGNVTWDAGSPYRLGAQHPQDNTMWGTARVELPNSVDPGASVTFNFNVTAPATPGRHDFQWRMVLEHVAWFGDFTPNLAVKSGVNDALFVSQVVPDIMTPGQTYAVSVTMRNSGNTTWTAANLYRLGSQNPQDNARWGTLRVELPDAVGPGATVTFNFNITAPGTVGTYNFQWRMVEDDVEWFGAFTTNVVVKDGLNDAAFVSQTVATTFTPGQTRSVTITMRNTGTSTWTAASLYRLGAQNPQDNTTWGPARVQLPSSVAAGASVAFTFDVTAPATVGSYNFQWRMVQDNVEWFGAFTPNLAINVQGARPPQVYYIHPDHLGTPREITRASDNAIVWRWDDTEAFGNSRPNEDPSGFGAFNYNLRFPGQYFDAETGTHYNYFRDYDSSLGRYIESDPLGLMAGLDTYAYTHGEPLADYDFYGLEASVCYKPLHALGKMGKAVYNPSKNLLFHQYLCATVNGQTVCGGQDRSGGPWSAGKPSDDKPGDGGQCFKVGSCPEADQCIQQAIGDKKRPDYGLVGPGANCQEWANDTYATCYLKCMSKR